MRILLLLIISFFLTPLIAQERFIMGQDRLVIKCSGIFQDSGGDNRPYGANESEMMVICADNTQGTHIKLTFSNADIATGDALCFFDGNDTNAAMLSCSSDFFPGSPFVIQATAANSTGCLTVTFNSNSSEERDGWNAIVDCIPACQLIQVALDKSDPPSEPIDTGWIDVCIGERVFFEGEGIFPQNGLVYEHTAATSTFEWDFGDGSSGKGPTVSHAYKESGGYRVELTVTDQFGCQSSNFISQRVRVSTMPDFTIKDNFPDQVCVGDTISLNGGVEGESLDAHITVASTEGLFLTKGFRSDSLALPDGNGRSYETSISFTDYRPGTALERIEDLQSICLNMEHSWLHDMEIFITCPNGRKAKLQEQVLINDEVFLGLPNDDDGINPTSGLGKEYCWIPEATFGTLTEFANRENDSDIGEPYYLPEGDFKSFEPLNQLVGCPLNGEWTITVTDLWEQDNGWIFSWGINFNPALLPKPESYTPAIASFQWADHPTIISKEPAEQPQIIQAIPTTPGNVSYTFETVDEYGCRNDTSIQVKVLPESHEECLKCDNNLFLQEEISLCEGDEVNLGTYIKPSSLGAITFENQQNSAFGKTTDEATISSTLDITGINPTTIGNSIEELVSVCINLETNFTGDISLFLRPPSGRNTITLVKNRGGDSNDFIQTCFSPKSTTPIENSTGPFTGVFAPEDDFSAFAGEDINGTWSLIASGDPGLIEAYTLKSWSLSFQGENTATYSWSPGTNISSTIGTDITLRGEQNTSPFYVLTKEENGCITEDTILINLVNADLPLEVSYSSFAGGEVLFYWVPIGEASGLQISEDGNSWRDTDDDFFHREQNLQQGESKSFQFRAIYANQNCATNPTSVVVNYQFCDLEAQIFAQDNQVRCPDGNDATIVVTATNGTPPYLFVLNDSIEQTDGTFDNLSVGTYEILVFDNNRICADTLSATIGSPEALGIDFNITTPTCFNAANGSISASPFGGAGGFQNFAWEGLIQTTPTLDNLEEGNYIFSAEDANGCLVSDTAMVVAPSPLQVDSTNNPASCFGELNGSAGVKVKGGTPPYAYLWADGQTTPNAVGLGIGTYQVTVTDNKGCQEEIEANVTQPDPISIDLKSTPISCADEKDASIVAEASGGIPPYRYKWDTEQSGKLNFGLQEGTYFITVTDANGCSEIAMEEIIATSPVLASTTATPPLCTNSPTGSIEVLPSGGNGPYTYLWSDSLAQTSPIATQLKADTYTVTVTDINGCETIATAPLSDPTALVVTPSGRDASCPDKIDGIGEIVVEGGSTPISFLWENGTTTSIQENLAPGAYPITVTDINNCVVEDTIFIESPLALSVDTLQKVAPSCNSDSNGSITAVILGGTTPYAFEWEGSIQQNPIEGIAAGFYDLKVTDSRDCELVVPNIQLEEPSPLSVTTKMQDVLCFGESTGEATAIPMGGTPPYQFRWSDGKNQNDSIATELPQGDYIVSVQDSNGCQEQALSSISQPIEGLVVSIEQTKIGCPGMSNSEATIQVSGGTGTDYSFTWGGLTNISATASQLEANTYFTTVTDENDCILESSIDIIELEPIEANFLSQEPSCFNTNDGSIVIVGVSGGANNNIEDYSFNWNTQDNSSQISNLQGDSVYQVTITDTQNCSAIVERYLGSPEVVSILSNQTNPSCFEGTNGTINVMGLSSNETVLSYEWEHTDSGLSNLENLSAGNYRLSAMSESGCTIFQNFVVDQPNAFQISNISTIPSECFGDQKGNISFEVTGGIPTYDYQWSNNTSQSSLINVNQGNYTVTITDENNCTTEESFTVEGPDSLASNTNAQSTSCFGEEDGRLELNPTGGTPPYMYSLDGNRYQLSNTFIGLAAGTYTSYIRDIKGCILEQANTAINPGDILQLDILAENENIAIGDSAILMANAFSTAGEIQLSWSSNNSENFDCLSENCESILVKPQSSTQFEVYGVDAAGCEAEASLFLRLSNPKKVFVPTGFSPNNDGFNDILRIHGQSNILIKYFRLYDRWGEEIFVATEFFVDDPAIYWDGTFKGRRLNAGIFTWVMEVEYLDQQREIFKGNTTLLK